MCCWKCVFTFFFFIIFIRWLVAHYYYKCFSCVGCFEGIFPKKDEQQRLQNSNTQDTHKTHTHTHRHSRGILRLTKNMNEKPEQRRRRHQQRRWRQRRINLWPLAERYNMQTRCCLCLMRLLLCAGNDNRGLCDVEAGWKIKYSSRGRFKEIFSSLFSELQFMNDLIFFQEL